ncbi:uncharacterized protein LOC119629012 [Bombyx mori]|uniref:uncharacterized protein LOC119629012 n=1 Tax=Bombyx mori TaxID=7091 RepID=UPI002ED4621B
MALPMTKAGSRRPPSSSSVVRPSSEATDIDADDGAGDGAPFPRAGLPLGGGISSAAEAESETTTTFSGGASVSEDDVSPPFPSREETPLDFLFRLTFPFGPAASQSLTSAERVEPALAHLGSTGFPLPVAQPPSSWHALPPPEYVGQHAPTEVEARRDSPPRVVPSWGNVFCKFAIIHFVPLLFNQGSVPWDGPHDWTPSSHSSHHRARHRLRIRAFFIEVCILAAPTRQRPPPPTKWGLRYGTTLGTRLPPAIHPIVRCQKLGIGAFFIEVRILTAPARQQPPSPTR